MHGGRSAATEWPLLSSNMKTSELVTFNFDTNAVRTIPGPLITGFLAKPVYGAAGIQGRRPKLQAALTTDNKRKITAAQPLEAGTLRLRRKPHLGRTIAPRWLRCARVLPRSSPWGYV